MVHFQLDDNKGFKWFSLTNIHAKGYLFDANNKLFAAEKITEYFKDIFDIEEFKSRVGEANGQFCVIIRYENECFAAVDRIRTFPLFYSEKDGNMYITDRADLLTGEKYEIVEENKIEFLATGYVTGKDTLLKNVFQVQSGEIIHISGNKIYSNFYYTFATDRTIQLPYNKLFERLHKVINSSFGRFIESLNGRTAVHLVVGTIRDWLQ